jgi:hypothetical protein
MDRLERYYNLTKEKVNQYFEQKQECDETPKDIKFSGRLVGLTTTHLDVQDDIIKFYENESISQSDLDITRYKLEDMIKYINLISELLK